MLVVLNRRDAHRAALKQGGGSADESAVAHGGGVHADPVPHRNPGADYGVADCAVAASQARFGCADDGAVLNGCVVTHCDLSRVPCTAKPRQHRVNLSLCVESVLSFVVHQPFLSRKRKVFQVCFQVHVRLWYKNSARSIGLSPEALFQCGPSARCRSGKHRVGEDEKACVGMLRVWEGVGERCGLPPRSTVPYHIEDPWPTDTSPTSDAEGATNAFPCTTGLRLYRLKSVRCRNTAHRIQIDELLREGLVATQSEHVSR